MKFVYVDEQQIGKGRNRYTSATAVVFDSETMQQYRESLISKICEILNYKTNIIAQLPLLHGNKMLDDLPDPSADQKLAIFELIFKLVHEHEVSIYRLGYYDQSVAFLKTDAKRIDFVLSELLNNVTDALACEQVHIYELNKSHHDKMVSYNDAYVQEMAVQLKARKSHLSPEHYGKVLGKFYCDKRNHFMYSADIVSWVLMKSATKNLSSFHGKIITSAKKITGHVFLNEIIRMKTYETVITIDD